MLETPLRPTGLTQPIVDGAEAGVIEDARRRQQRQRRIAAALTVAGVAIGGLIVGFAGGGGGSGTGHERHNRGPSPSPGAHASSHVVATVIPTTHLCYSASARARPYPHVVAGDFGALDIPCAQQAPKGYEFLGEKSPETVIALVNITFKARVDANNQNSVYEFSDGRASGPASCRSGGESGTTEHPIHAGQTVMLQDAPMCPGTYVGIITYQPHGAPGRDTLLERSPVHDGSITVGRYSYIVH